MTVLSHVLAGAALSGHIPPGARSLQRRWDSVITVRAVLQAAAVAALCAALALP